MMKDFISNRSNEDPKKKTTKSDNGVSLCNNNARKVQSFHGCNLCGKTFQSPKSLFGHMRIHPGKAKRLIPCKTCGDKFFSLKSLINHTALHLVRAPEEPTRACSSLTSAEKSCNVTTALNLTLDEESHMNKYKASSSVTENEQEEIEEVAMSLMMLSEGFHADENVPRDDNSASLEVKSTDQNSLRVKSEENCSFGSTALRDKQEKIKPEMDDPLMDNAEVKPKSSAYRSLMFNDSCQAQLLEIPCLSDETHEESQDNTGYRCKTCHKVFSCFRGLGGHRSRGCNTKSNFEANSLPDPTVSEVKTGSETNKGDEVAESVKLSRSKRIRIVFKNMNFGDNNSLSAPNDSEVCSTDSETNQPEVGNVTELRNVDPKEDNCMICLKVFDTDQALGVHKMHHLTKGLEITAEKTVKIDTLLDLRMDKES